MDLKRDKKARELAIADNRVGEIDLDWNPEVLASLDVDLKQFWNENELNALLKDFRRTELLAPEPKLDQAAELQKKWKTKRGQIWEIGEHRLMCGDSANATDVAALMDGKTAKLCATDPPYLVSYDAKNHPSMNFSDGKNKDWKGRYADKQKSEPLGPFYEAFLRQVLAVCEADAAIYVWHASQRQMEVEKSDARLRHSRSPANHLGQEQAGPDPLFLYVATRTMFLRLEARQQAEAQSRRFPHDGLADRCAGSSGSRIPPPD